jgi:catechol 2,3-dioxygenase-like lactoylglutathione lyase family enzyme
MDARLWNIGIKVADLDVEIDYFCRAGGALKVRERFKTVEGEFQYAFIEFVGSRLFLTPKPIFEDKLEGPLSFGLTHVVFEVGNVDEEARNLAAAGSKILIEPQDIKFALGKRRICFLRSPGGLVHEIMTIYDSSL